jgi:hypothetical protein
METVDKLLPTNDGHINECYVFHDPLEKVYEAITNINTITKLLSPNILIIKVLRETKIDDEGNEIYISILNNNFTLQTMSTQKVKNIIQYKLRCIHYPLCYCPFEILTQIFWDSIDKITVLHIKITIDDSPHQNELINFFKQNTVNFKKIEKYLKKTIKNLEENESIFINKDITKVWDFLQILDNLKYFFPMNIEINYDNNEIIKIIDLNSKNEMKLTKKEILENPFGKMIIQLEMFESIIPVPKQRIEISLIKVKENLTLIEFKHIILEYIPYDALQSNSNDKQKILKKVKKILEL